MLRTCSFLHGRRRSHVRSGIRTPYVQLTALVGIFCWLASTTAMAQPHIAERKQGGVVPDVILAVASLNFDCYADTVFGQVDEQFHYLPYEIHWGAAPANADTACVSETPRENRERITTIAYPNWKRITGSVSFERMNADTLTDIVLYLWGVPTDGANDEHDGERGNRRSPGDSLRALVLFGQVGLDSVRQIELSSIAPFQSAPYFAMELTPGADLRNEKKRDLSGTPSYEVKRVSLDVREKKDTTERGPLAPPLANVAAPESTVEVRVYPNPSAAETQITADRLPPGQYAIEVIAVNGTVALHQDVMVSQSRNLLRSLDVRELPSGYYVLRLHRTDSPATGGVPNQWAGTFPIIVTR